MTTRAPKGLVLFREDGDRRLYLELLFAEVEERGWSLRSYCLMTNHLHILVMTPEPDLAKGMKRIHERFAMRMHARHEGHGHVFGARFKNKPVRSAQHEVACLRYIARNPVEAGICARPADYRWSAHRSLIGLDPPPRCLDVAATRRAISLAGYVQMTDLDESRLLERLIVDRPATWMADAVDFHAISVEAVAGFLGIHRTTVYKRLALARATQGSDPSVATEGSGP